MTPPPTCLECNCGSPPAFGLSFTHTFASPSLAPLISPFFRLNLPPFLPLLVSSSRVVSEIASLVDLGLEIELVVGVELVDMLEPLNGVVVAATSKNWGNHLFIMEVHLLPDARCPEAELPKQCVSECCPGAGLQMQ